MPGAAGSLLQLLETAGCGAVLEVDRLPRPDGVAVERWLRTFPSFGFLLAAPAEHADAARDAFTRRGLACEVCGHFNDSRSLQIEDADGARATVWDFDIAPLTGLGGG
jgi:selenophosphate synthetase-related protein